MKVLKEEKVEVKLEENKDNPISNITPPPSPSSEKQNFLNQINKIEKSGASSKRAGIAIQDLKTKIQKIDDDNIKTY